jgi:hypothetical protein
VKRFKWLLVAAALLCGVVLVIAVTSLQSPGLPSPTHSAVASAPASARPGSSTQQTSAPSCPSQESLASLILDLDRKGPSDPQMGVGGAGPNTYAVADGVVRLSVEKMRCFDDWLIAHVTGYFAGPGSAPANDLVVLHRSGGRWVLYINGGTDHSGTYGCKPPVPGKARLFMGCT